VNADTTGDYIWITVDEESGATPFEATLRVEGTFTFTEEATLTYTGPDEVEFLENPNENEYTVRIETPGLYFFTAEVDHEGTTYADTIAILAMDQGELDALLRAKWEAMRQALIAGDIDTAVGYFRSNRRSAYNEVFQVAGGQIAAVLPASQNIDKVKINTGKARYSLDLEAIVEDEPMTVSSYIIFEKDEDGLWTIVFF